MDLADGAVEHASVVTGQIEWFTQVLDDGLRRRVSKGVSARPLPKRLCLPAAGAGFYESPGWGRKFPRLQLLTVTQLLDGKRIDYPLWKADVSFKNAPKGARAEAEQIPLVAAPIAPSYRIPGQTKKAGQETLKFKLTHYPRFSPLPIRVSSARLRQLALHGFAHARQGDTGELHRSGSRVRISSSIAANKAPVDPSGLHWYTCNLNFRIFPCSPRCFAATTAIVFSRSGRTTARRGGPGGWIPGSM